jgi:hypothetical protein
VEFGPPTDGESAMAWFLLLENEKAIIYSKKKLQEHSCMHFLQ